MEAFLTLTEGDLHELGISQSDAILAAITQLNSGKVRQGHARTVLKRAFYS